MRSPAISPNIKQGVLDALVQELDKEFYSLRGNPFEPWFSCVVRQVRVFGPSRWSLVLWNTETDGFKKEQIAKMKTALAFKIAEIEDYAELTDYADRVSHVIKNCPDCKCEKCQPVRTAAEVGTNEQTEGSPAELKNAPKRYKL